MPAQMPATTNGWSLDARSAPRSFPIRSDAVECADCPTEVRIGRWVGRESILKTLVSFLIFLYQDDINPNRNPICVCRFHQLVKSTNTNYG